MKHYRIKYGYGKDEFISVDEEELPKALKAQVTGQIAALKEGALAGNSIIAIVPDYQRDMGWNRDHVMGGEDYAEIGERKQEGYRLFLEDTKLSLEGKTRPERKEISAGAKQLAERMNATTRDR